MKMVQPIHSQPEVLDTRTTFYTSTIICGDGCEVLTCTGAAASIRAAGAADVATAGVWATLTPADPDE